jgi:hypothetical protein
MQQWKRASVCRRSRQGVEIALLGNRNRVEGARSLWDRLYLRSGPLAAAGDLEVLPARFLDATAAGRDAAGIDAISPDCSQITGWHLALAAAAQTHTANVREPFHLFSVG